MEFGFFSAEVSARQGKKTIKTICYFNKIANFMISNLKCRGKLFYLRRRFITSLWILHVSKALDLQAVSLWT